MSLPPPQSQPLPPPQGQPVYVATRPTSGKATASLVLGLIGIFGSWCTLGIPSILAVLLGHAALQETKTGERGGHGMAIAGLILGYILAIPAVIVTVSYVFAKVF